MKPDTSSTILLRAPVEVWECLLSVSPSNPFAESEAIVLEAMASVGTLDGLSEAVGGRLPLNTISSLLGRGLASLGSDGAVEVSEEAAEAIREGGLVEFLRSSGSKEAKATVVRDLLTGGFHSLEVLEGEGDGHEGQVLNPDALQAPRRGMDMGSVNVSDLISPVAFRVAHDLGFDKAAVLSSSRLLEVTSRSTEAAVTYQWHRRQDGVHQPIPVQESDLARRILSEAVVPELSPQADDEEVKREWPASAELDALERIDIASKMIRRSQKGHARVGKSLLVSLVGDAADALEGLADGLASEDGAGRADGARVVVGTEFEQWGAVQEVIGSTESSCVLLSAFTWKGFAGDTSERFREALPDGCDLLLLSGEPDRINETGFAKRTEKYGRALSEHGAPAGVRIETTKRASHAKFAISDSGMLWIGSCNLLSAAPGSWVLESGLVFRDPVISRAVIDHVLEDGWLSEGGEAHLRAMRDSLPERPPSQPDKEAMGDIASAASRLRGMLGGGGFDPNEAKEELDGLVPVLRGFAERPRWQLVRTDQHRPAMLSLIRSARKRIALGSDAIRKRGLDQSTIVEIARRPGEVENRATKYTVQLYWGRHDPEAIKRRGREEIEEARGRLGRLCEEVVKYDEGGKGLRAKFFPFKSRDPMMTHCKFVAVDDARLLLTSDNVLSFSDDEGFDSDARELGVLLDSPRLARMLRSEMELLVRQSRDPWDRGRWSGALAWALEESGEDELPLDEAMGSLFGRIGGSDSLSEDWDYTVGNMCKTRDYDHTHAPYNLAREGAGDGLFELVWKGGGERPWEVSYDSPDFGLVSLGRVTANWSGAGRKRVDPKDVDPKEFSAALIGAMVDPDSWEALTTPHSKMVAARPELRVKKTARFIEGKCAEWIEMKKSETGHPWIRRR